MNILFVMDPLAKIHPQKDTTFLLIRECLRRGITPFFCDHRELFFHNGTVSAPAKKILEFAADPKKPDRLHAKVDPAVETALRDFRCVFMRTDPPVDDAYLLAAHLLELATAQTTVLNAPSGLLRCNEKLYTLVFFKEFCPETLVSGDGAQIRAFVKSVGGKAVVKPLNLSGGEGVFILNENDAFQPTDTVIVQRFVPEAKLGDKRIILIDGEAIGAVNRVAQGKEFRNNLHLGGRAERTALTSRDLQIAAAVAPRLRQDGHFLVGLDILGPYLTEINVTSPTCFQEINHLEGYVGDQTLEAKTFDRLLKKLGAA